MCDEIKFEFPVCEIFDSVQGEGWFTGCKATFVRLSGCNLHCPWCDTNHEAKMGKLDIPHIIEEMKKVNEKPSLVVITGGEPTIHENVYLLCLGIKKAFENVIITMETNGTNPQALFRMKALGYLDFITVSPKDSMFDRNIADSLLAADEIKVVLSENTNPEIYEPLIKHLMERNRAYIQPCSENYAPVIDFIKKHDGWRISVQIQKILKVF